MSHFAKIDSNNIVTKVAVSEQDFINSGRVGDSFLWLQTSYNDNFRKQYAGIGFSYDKVNDVFLKPKPFPSWTLDENFDWESGVAPPDSCTVQGDIAIHSNGMDFFNWNEETKSWDLTIEERWTEEEKEKTGKQ